MIKVLALLAGFAAGLVLGGCIATQQVVPFPDQNKLVEDPGKGRIYVIGDPLYYNYAAHKFLVTVVENERLVGHITGHGFICWEREPGTTTIMALFETPVPDYQSKKSTVNLNVESGKVYYLRMHVGVDWSSINILVPGSGNPTVKLELMQDEKGSAALLESQPPQVNK